MASNGRILLVDDNDDMREAMRGVLRDHGYEVLEASDGESGLRALRSHRGVDLVVLDLMMPVMNGATFRWHQRWDHSIATIPVLIATSVADAEKTADFLRAQGYLRKPFDAAALLSAVERAIARPEKNKRAG